MLLTIKLLFTIMIIFGFICSHYLRKERIGRNSDMFKLMGFNLPGFGFGTNKNSLGTTTSSFSTFRGFSGFGNNTISNSYSSSKSYVSSDINGVKKEEGIETEEWRNKNGTKPAVVRKYGQVFKKNQTNPAILMKRAKSNIEEENIFLDKPEVENLNSNEEKVNLL